MRRLIVFATLGAIALCAQILLPVVGGKTPALPTANLVALWDGTVYSGSTLTDLSGNGHNGTIPGTGVTKTSFGLQFDGSHNVTVSSLISIPGSDFTIVAVAKQTTLNVKTTLFDGCPATCYDAGGNGFGVGFASPRIYYYNGSGFTYSTDAPNVNTWDTYVASYHSGKLTIYRDGNVSGSLSGLTAPTAITTGTQHIGLNLTGTIAVIGVYNVSLPDSGYTPAYLDQALQNRVAARGIAPNRGSWVSGGTVLAPDLSTEYWVTVPTVIYESGCVIVSSPCYRMWYNAGKSVDFRYAESSTPTGPFQRWASNPIGALTNNGGFGRLVKNPNDSTTPYWLYMGANPARLYRSADGLTFGAATNLTGTGNLEEVSVLIENSTTYWMMSYPTPNLWTSADGISWTSWGAISTGGFGCNYGWFTKLSSTYYWWALSNAQDGSLCAVSDPRTSQWPKVPTGTVLARAVTDEGIYNANGQSGWVGSIIEQGGTTYAYYAAVADYSVPSASWGIRIKVAKFNGTMAQLVSTNEGWTTQPVVP